MIHSFFLTLFIMSTLQIKSLYGEISDLRKCADALCKGKISLGRTTQLYMSKEKDVLSFKVDEVVTVYSKAAGKNSHLWGVEIKGKRGYVPYRFIKEEKVYVKSVDLKHTISTGSLSKEKGAARVIKESSSEVKTDSSTSNFVTTQTGNEKIDEDLSNPSAEEIVQTENPSESIILNGEDGEFAAVKTLVNREDPQAAVESSKKVGESTVSSGSNEKNTNMNSETDSTGDVTSHESYKNNKVVEIATNKKIEENSADVDNKEMDTEDDDDDDDEEMDNEDEGNGNEGEENGSEYVIKKGEEEEVIGETISPMNSPVTQSSITPDSSPEGSSTTDISPNIKEEILSDNIHLENVTPDLPTKPPSSLAEDLPQPTPSKNYEVVDGTTVYMDDSEIQRLAFNEHTSSILPLEASQVNKDYTTKPTPSHSKHEKFFITERPIVFRGLKEMENSAESKSPSETGSSNHLSYLVNGDEKKLGGGRGSSGIASVSAGHEVSNEEVKNNFDQPITSKISPQETEEFSSQKPDQLLESKQQSKDNWDEQKQPETAGSCISSLRTSTLEALKPSSEGEQATTVDTLTQGTQEEPENTSEESVCELEKKTQEIDRITEDQIAPMIANLPFIDPDSSKSPAEQQPTEDVNNTAEETRENTLESAQEAAMQSIVSDISSENESNGHLTSGIDVTEEGDVPSLKDQLLDASGPLLLWFSQTFKLNEGMSLAIEGELADPRLSTGTFAFLLVVAGTIVVLYWSHMIIVKISRESPLLETMNKLDRDHRILVQENNNLKQQLTDSNGQIKSATCVDPSELQKMKEQLEMREKKFHEEIEEFTERNQQLENDLESSTANEVELHRMLNELLANQKETSNFEDSVNSLQVMLDGQREVVESLTSDLALKKRLNDELRNELKNSKSKTAKLEYQIEQLTHSMEEVNASKQEFMKKLTEEANNMMCLKEINVSLRREVDKASETSTSYCDESLRLKEEIKKLKRRLGNKEAECQVSKECLKKLQVFSDGGGNDIQGKLAELFKIIEVKTQLTSAEKECSTLHAQLEESEKRQCVANERVKNLENETTRMKDTVKTLQKERDEAKAKLRVLTQYYEEKETQLKKELESHEGLLQCAEGSAAVVSNKIQVYEMELVSCRSQIEGLKSELEQQKQSYKIQLTNEEKKLQNSWLAARAAERRQEELRQENSQLRQKLSQIQKDSEQQNMLIKPSPKRIEANGSVSSPIPMENDLDSLHPNLPLDLEGPPLPPPPRMMPMFHGRPPPLPPGMPPGLPPGLPPPPMHPHLFGHLPPPPPMPDRRMPPAGRIASPPGYDRRSYSPGSDHSPYSDQRYSPGPRYSPTNNPRSHSPDRKSDHLRRNANSRREQRSPSPSDTQRHSPERWYTQSPQGFTKHHRSPPSMDYYDGGANISRRTMTNAGKGKKTSTPNDR